MVRCRKCGADLTEFAKRERRHGFVAAANGLMNAMRAEAKRVAPQLWEATARGAERAGGEWARLANERGESKC